jgi:hypothetical protein
MSKENGFLQLRRGIWQHVRNGQMNVNDFAIYVYILSEADTRTGVWKGCAQSISAALKLPLSTVKYSLAKMDGKYIKRFMVLGHRTAYPILCHRYLASSSTHVGRMLDAINTTNERELQWFPPEPLNSSSTHVLPDVGRQKRSENREKRIKKEAQALPSLSFSCEWFSVTEKQDAALGEAFPWIDRTAEYRKVRSWLEANPERRPKKAARFLHNWFSRTTQPKGKANGKDINSAVEATMRGFAANAGLTN